MTKTSLYVGMDVATVCGITVFNPDLNRALTYQVKGTPVEQLRFLFDQNVVPNQVAYRNRYTFVFEKEMNLRNAKTVRSLFERQGFLKYSLIALEFRVLEVEPQVARSFLGTKGKEDTFMLFTPRFQGTVLTNNHTDALAVALYQAHQDEWNIDLQAIEIRGQL